VRRAGQPVTVKASAEVILSAEAINSPQILQLSGIGSGEFLKSHGIDVVLDQPAVGENLQGHLQIRAVFKVGGAKTLLIAEKAARCIQGAAIHPTDLLTWQGRCLFTQASTHLTQKTCKKCRF
jgi:choline dehydrogenase-like flavoprotein